jgi:SPX domain protein involved in polyphosphate accumulation
VANLGGAYLSKLDRYELKYIIPYEMVEPMTEFLMAYCSLDYHSTTAPNQFYQVNSLYFDTPNLTFATNRLYVRSPRFNMRSRAYADGTKPPYFLEIKVKDGNVVNKYRAKVGDDEWPHMFTDLNYRTNLQGDPKELKNKELFYRTAMKYNSSPRIYTQYKRRAFVSEVDEYVRVTMDIDMKCFLEDQYTLKHDPKRLINYDSELVYAKVPNRPTGSNVILELKCYPHQVPLWLLDLIKRFQLNRTSFSKYLASLQTAITYDERHKQFFDFNDRINARFSK